MKKTWLPVEGYENYQVSNFGEVKSLGNDKSRKEKLLKPQKDSKGYFFVCLCKNGIKKPVRINRLVYSTFVGDIPDRLEVNHLDENKENNRVDNLNLMTSKENNNWATANARRAAARSKAVEAVDKVTGRVIYTFSSTQEAGRQGFNHGNISECCLGQRKSHKGFIWRYKENAQEQ